MRSSVFASIVALVAVVLTAASTPAEDSKEGLDVETQFGRIVQVGSWLDLKVFGLQGKLIGETKDAALDLETGHLALLLIKLEGLDEKMPGYLAVPPVALKATDKGLQLRNNVHDARLATARRLPESAYHRQLNRGWAEQQFTLFEQQAYWIRPVKVKGKDSPEQPIEHDSKDKSYMLTLASTLQDVQVNGQDDQPLGKIRGFAIAPGGGQIVYAALELQQQSGELYPVPLGAFVVDRANPWSIALGRKIVSGTPSFSPDNWPSKVERGWIEYVHVRYGRAAIGGVQQKQSTEQETR